MNVIARCSECGTRFQLQGQDASLQGLVSYYCAVCERPVRLRPAAPEADLSDAASPGGGRGRVLLLEDRGGLAEEMIQLLRSAGYQVRAAEEAPSALRILREFRPDIVILDLAVHGADSLDLLRSIRAEAGEKPPVLVLSGPIRSTDVISQVHALGASGMIPRPAVRDTLLFRVESLLQ